MYSDLPECIRNVINRETAAAEAAEKEALDYLDVAIRHMTDGEVSGLNRPERKPDPEPTFRPMVRQGRGDGTLLVAVPESSFRRGDFASFRAAADDAIAHIRHHRATYCPGGAAFSTGFDLEQRPLAYWGLDAEGRATAYYNAAIRDSLEFMTASGLIEAERTRYSR